MAIHLANSINLSIEPDTFPSQCKIAKTKSLLKKHILTEAKNYRLISQLCLISNVIEKFIQYYLQRNELL